MSEEQRPTEISFGFRLEEGSVVFDQAKVVRPNGEGQDDKILIESVEDSPDGLIVRGRLPVGVEEATWRAARMALSSPRETWWEQAGITLKTSDDVPKGTAYLVSHCADPKLSECGEHKFGVRDAVKITGIESE